MAFCTSCGHDFGTSAFCTNCGQKAQKADPPAAPSSPVQLAIGPDPIVGSAGVEEATPARNPKRAWYLAGAGAAIIVILVIVGAVTARHWVKIDVPAHPETFHAETYLTGYYDISDDHVNPCWIGEDWTTCTNYAVQTYNSTCAAFPLTYAGSAYCRNYAAMIDTMQAQDRYGYYVVSLGTWGTLSAVPESATEQVSNNDYRAAITHKAVCVFGFLGECK